MTDIVIPSTDRTAVSLAFAAASRHADTDRVFPADEPVFDPPLETPEGTLDNAGLEAFDEDGVSTGSDSDFELVVDGGEAFVQGCYLARDEPTTVVDDFDDGEAVIGVGWAADQPDDITIQRIDRFGGNQGYVELWRIVDDDGPTIDEDLRVLFEDFERDVVRAEDELQSDGSSRLIGPVSLGEFDSENGIIDFEGFTESEFFSQTRWRLINNEGTLEIVRHPDTPDEADRMTFGSTITVKAPFVTTNVTSLGDGSGVVIDSILRLVTRTSDPGAPNDGWIWYRDDLGEYRGQIDGNVVKFDTTEI